MSPLTAQAHTACVESLHTRISDILVFVPNLRKYVLKIFEDEKSPAQARRLIQRALLDVNLEIYDLTEDLKRAWGIPQNTVAFAQTNMMDSWSDAKETLTDNESFSKGILDEMPRGSFVAIATGHEVDDLVSLFHELTHVRFSAFIEKNYDQICKRMPPSFVRHVNGRCLMNKEFLDYVSEKMAWENQYKLTFSVGQRDFPNAMSQNISAMANLPPRELHAYIGKRVITSYRYTSPLVTATESLSVREILSAGPEMWKIDRELTAH